MFYLLEAAGFEAWLVNAKDVKRLPGRPKTGKLDCIWLCKVAERQMIRPSVVPPPPFRKLRDLTRYRADLVAARTAEKNRVEKLLEDAQSPQPMIPDKEEVRGSSPRSPTQVRTGAALEQYQAAGVG